MTLADKHDATLDRTPGRTGLTNDLSYLRHVAPRDPFHPVYFRAASSRNRFDIETPSRAAPYCGGLALWQERHVRAYVDENLSEAISLARLAAECRLSSSYFSTAFKKTLGCAPHKWLVRRRVERASDLMATTSRPLSDIALAVGFADQSHFTRVFSRYMHATPAAWRRAHTEQRLGKTRKPTKPVMR